MTQQTCPYLIDRSGSDVHHEAGALSAIGPAVQVELPGGVIGWSITTRDLAMKLMRDPRISKDPRKHWPPYINGELDENWPMIGWAAMNNMTTSYGTDHTRLRRLIAQAFTPRRVEEMRPRVERITGELLDALAKRSETEVVDLKREYAYQVPAQVICELFGIPIEDRAEVLRGGEVNIDTRISAQEAQENVERWHSAMTRLVSEKRKQPGDDLTTDLIAVRDDEGSQLTDDELVGTLHLMLGAASETVMNLLSHAVLALLSHSAQRELVRSGERSWSDVIEEALRVESPVAQLPFRYPIEEIKLGDVTIRPVSRSSSPTAPSAAIRPCTAMTHRRSTSPARTRTTCPSATASTSVSVRRWHALRPTLRCPRCSIGSRNSNSHRRWPTWSRRERSS